MFHVNPETGEPGKCTAQIQCRFGSQEHFETQEQAREFYENSMKEELINESLTKALGLKLPSWSASDPVKQERRKMKNIILADAISLADDMALDPDYLPPIDDPSKPDGIDEEEGYIDSLEQLKDPSLAMGNCGITAEAVQAFEPKFEYIEEEVGGPYLNIHAANTFTDKNNDEWVIDYTFSQVDPTHEWPYVGLKQDWLAQVHNAGFQPADEIRKIYDEKN